MAIGKGTSSALLVEEQGADCGYNEANQGTHFCLAAIWPLRTGLRETKSVDTFIFKDVEWCGWALMESVHLAARALAFSDEAILS